MGWFAKRSIALSGHGAVFGRAIVVGEKLRLGRADLSWVACSLAARIVEDVLASQAVAADHERVSNSADVAVGRPRQTQIALQNTFCAQPSVSLQRECASSA